MEVITSEHHDSRELLSNTYIIIDGQDCLVIDPSNNSDSLTNYLRRKNLHLKGVLLTHSHFDHIGGVQRLVDNFKAPVYVHEDDVIGLTDITYNCSIMGNDPKKYVVVKVNPVTFIDGEEIKLLSKPLKVIHTPFHTLGSSCFYLEDENILFSGDTLFRFVVGRTDLPSSKASLMNESLNKLKNLPDEVVVYPGHGSHTSIGIEKRYNRFLREA